MLKIPVSKQTFNSVRQSNEALLLLLWVVIGGILRLSQLSAKPPWTDEFATLVFSLGNHFTSVPLDRLIDIHTLLQPLQLNSGATIGDIVTLMLREDNHPPLYFVLSHLWLKAFPAVGGYVSLWGARSLSVLLGILSIPAIYLLAKIAFRSRLIAQLSAAFMAVSPYAVFIAQEARHYTLAILFVITSLICLMVAARHLWQGTRLPLWLVFSWIVVNGLGLSSHYFFSLALLAEALTLLGLLSYQVKWPRRFQATTLTEVKLPNRFTSNWLKIALVALGTMATGLVWLWLIVPHGYGHDMTGWISKGRLTFLGIINPPFQLLAAWVTILALLPVESASLPIVILSGLGLLLFFIWAIPRLKQGLKTAWQYSLWQLGIGMIGGYIVSAIAVFLFITYIVGVDITRGARYSFVYFPTVIVLIAVSLAKFWQERYVKNAKQTHSLGYYIDNNGRVIVALIWVMSLLGSITVLANLGYQKYYLSDRFVNLIEKTASYPVLIATPHKSLAETGEMMGIAWELNRQSVLKNTQFLLAHQNSPDLQPAINTVQQIIETLPRPLEVWAVNFYDSIELKGCQLQAQKFLYVNGYGYQRFICQ